MQKSFLTGMVSMIRIFVSFLLFIGSLFAEFAETPWMNPQTGLNSDGKSWKDSTIKSRKETPPKVDDEWPRYFYDVEEEKETEEEKKEEKKQEPKDKSYRLKIGDKLLISLYGFSEGNTSRVVTVSPTGSINYLFVKPIFASGRTIDEVKRDLQHSIEKLYPNVMASITAVQLFGDQYTILGEVQLPGTKFLNGNMTLLKAIGTAGGFPLRSFRSQTVDYADLDHAFLARNGDIVPVDFKRLVRGGDTTQDVSLQAGDYVYIPSLVLQEIYVLGEVQRNFVYTYMEPASLMEVLTWAGGVTDKASSRVAVIRGSLCFPTRYIIDRHLIAKGCMPDFPLCPGDIVYVPPRHFTNLENLVKDAIRAFVGAVAIQAGENAFDSINPNARLFNNNTIIVNPGSVPVQQPPPIIISP